MHKRLKTGLKTEIARVLSSLTLMAVLCGAAMGLGSSPAHAIALKERSMVKGNMITLGDIFYGLPRDEERVLGPAPRPGHDMVLNARTLMRIAVALDLPWRPTSSADYVVLSRAATIIENKLIEDVLHDALMEEGVGKNFEISISDGVPEIILPNDMAPSVEVSALEFNHSNNRFTATLTAPSRDNPIHVAKVYGRIDQLTSVPVLSQPMRAGDVIGQRDIEIKNIPNRYLKGEPILRAEDLIGMTPRRFLSAGEPVRVTEIEPPRVVKRGENITMIFANNGLLLSATGKALQDGARGDIIRVVNASSNRTIDALVTGDREVTVKTF